LLLAAISEDVVADIVEQRDPNGFEISAPKDGML
jgi:hypothetical protein